MKTFQREEQMKNLELISMSNIGIPANADNKVVAGENAKSIYAVVEVFYTSIAGREYGCEYIFNDLVDAKKYVQERLESYLEWTIVYHECDPTDQEEMDEFNEDLEFTFDDEDMVYGYYPFGGDKNFLEFHIKEVEMFNK
ncbi:MAG: hypothetical protein IKA70_00140 [Alistipes sp.]|nr:hypothetical protein [Alistipes sp.]